MTYDIGIGRCTEINDDTVVVKLESVMVKRLSPEHPWQRSGTSLLRLNRSLCSAVRPPERDSELYLDRAALSKRSMAALPPSHALWKMDNVVVTPHISGPSTPDEIAPVFNDNLARYLAGRPLRYVVDRSQGY